jgi:hypothetical protein
MFRKEDQAQETDPASFRYHFSSRSLCLALCSRNQFQDSPIFVMTMVRVSLLTTGPDEVMKPCAAKHAAGLLAPPSR